MNSTRLIQVVTLLVVGFVTSSTSGCSSEEQAATTLPPGAASSPSASVDPASVDPASSGGSEAGSQASDELSMLDPRRPVPLMPMMAWHQKQNMMEHLVAIQRITDATAREDWAAVEEAAAMITPSPKMEQMCHHMGAGAEGFTAMALDFHQRAVAIGHAAQQADRAGVLRATSHTLEACTGCHAVFRQEVVDAATWSQRTGL